MSDRDVADRDNRRSVRTGGRRHVMMCCCSACCCAWNAASDVEESRPG